MKKPSPVCLLLQPSRASDIRHRLSCLRGWHNKPLVSAHNVGKFWALWKEYLGKYIRSAELLDRWEKLREQQKKPKQDASSSANTEFGQSLCSIPVQSQRGCLSRQSEQQSPRQSCCRNSRQHTKVHPQVISYTKPCCAFPCSGKTAAAGLWGVPWRKLGYNGSCAQRMISCQTQGEAERFAATTVWKSRVGHRKNCEQERLWDTPGLCSLSRRLGAHWSSRLWRGRAEQPCQWTDQTGACAERAQGSSVLSEIQQRSSMGFGE